MTDTPPRIFRLTLVRHGQTTHNKLKIIQGQMETNLTELGREQAQLLSDYFERTRPRFDRVFSSDLKRALDTCEIISKGRYEIATSQLLRERAFGVLQGKPLEMLRAEAYRAGHNDSNFTKYRPEDGESMEEVQNRILRFCKCELFPRVKHSERVLVVTHGGVIREFFKYFIKYGCPIDNKDLIVTPNTAYNDFDIELVSGNKMQRIVRISMHKIPHLCQKAKEEALSEEQLNDATSTGTSAGGSGSASGSGSGGGSSQTKTAQDEEEHAI